VEETQPSVAEQSSAQEDPMTNAMADLKMTDTFYDAVEQVITA
jgi:hypothetical protein